jgi:uncharacterized membrane protein
VKVVSWIVSRLVIALILGAILGALGYYVVVPAVVSAGYRQQLPLNHFVRSTGSGVAGSQDAVYLAARFDCRDAVTEIVGPSPDAQYWMIGIYDNWLQRIPGGHLNDTTVEVGQDGQFHLLIQQRRGNAQNTLECGNKRTGIVIFRVFLPRDPEAVIAPTIQRRPSYPNP